MHPGDRCVDRYADGRSLTSRRSQKAEALVEFVARQYAGHTNLQVVDFGCADGAMPVLLLRSAVGAWFERVTGITLLDYNDLPEKPAFKHPRFCRLIADLEGSLDSLDLPWGTCDLVLAGVSALPAATGDRLPTRRQAAQTRWIAGGEHASSAVATAAAARAGHVAPPQQPHPPLRVPQLVASRRQLVRLRRTGAQGHSVVRPPPHRRLGASPPQARPRRQLRRKRAGRVSEAVAGGPVEQWSAELPRHSAAPPPAQSAS